MIKDIRIGNRFQGTLGQAVIGKLKAEGLTIESPWEEIEAVLSRVGMPTKCKQAAKELRAERGIES